MLDKGKRFFYIFPKNGEIYFFLYSGHAEMWVADVNGKPVGSIMLQETEEKGVGQLRLFLLEKAYRRHGIGKALLDFVMEKTKEWHFRHLFLWTAARFTKNAGIWI